jgi:DnaJ-class molecular chaperone
MKKAFYALAQKHHPDKGGDEEVFKSISNAYETLGDENKRMKYDLQQKQDKMKSKTQA